MLRRTWAFAIHFNHSSTPVAHALICPETRFVAVQWQEGRLDRRHVPAALWPGLEQELTGDLGRVPVSPSSLISTVLVGSMGALMRVTFLDTQAVSISSLEDAERVFEVVEAVPNG